MTRASMKVLSLDSAGADNWMLCGAPEAASIVNPAASLHRCIAWSWAEADALHGLAQGFSDLSACDNPVVFDASMTVFADRLRAMTVMLEHLSNLTAKSQRMQD